MSPQAAFRTIASAIVALMLLLVAACGGTTAPGLPVTSDDGGSTEGGNALIEGGPETSVDGAADARVDGSADATVDGASDASVDGRANASDAKGGMTLDAPATDSTIPIADAMGCGASTCPTGCCDTSGRCQTGDSTNACGTTGQACQDCVAQGLKSCDATSHACFTTTAQCGPATCKGCCLQNVCYAGTSSTDCGSGGQACQSCPAGVLCTGQQCAMPSCGPENCAGCCIGTQCLLGTDTAACGQGGGKCTDCGASGAPCVPSNVDAGGACGPACGPATCSGCCDANGVCQLGTSSMVCGVRGGTCQACSLGTECMNQECSCTDQTCPAGCCEYSFAGRGRGRGGMGMPMPAPMVTCLPGTSDMQCGTAAATCQDCTNAGPYTCVNQQCNIPPPPAPCQCTTGCCDSLGECHPGASNTQCGYPGNTCQDCTQLVGEVCENQQCTTVVDVDSAVVCNAESCPSGCCDFAGVCQQGVTSLACGAFGTNCQNCLQTNALCSNQQCVTPLDAGTGCSMANCGGCCDPLGNCVGGGGDTQCGSGGRLCIDCSTLGDQCQGNACTATDGAALCSQTCPGCCDVSGNCRDGFAGKQCGQFGSTCQDCTSLTPASTCDVVVSPRTCASEQTQCPGPYPSCPAPLQETVPASQNVCSAIDLQNAAGACAGGAHTMACTTFLQNGSNASCGTCLAGFDFDFVEQVGIRTCVAPFVDASCNHNSACIVDCVAESCYGCPDTPSTTQCETQAPSAACAAFSQADACVTTALNGLASVCNPTTYQENFGAWLQAVGAKYCGL